MTLQDGSTILIYRVEWAWGYLGEDGEADEEIDIYSDLKAAKASFKAYAKR